MEKLSVADNLEKTGSDYWKKDQVKLAKHYFSQALSKIHPDDKERKLRLLLQRSECSLKLQNFSDTIEDCLNVISLSNDSNTKAKTRLIFVMCRLEKFLEAKTIVRNWLSKDPNSDSAKRASKKLDHLMATFTKGSLSEEYFEMDEMDQERKPPDGMEEAKMSNSGISEEQSYTCSLESKKDLAPSGPPTELTCNACNLNFKDSTELTIHRKTNMHNLTVLSEEGRAWKYRPPPRGVGEEYYFLCDEAANCRFGEQCVDAHSEAELHEWKERFMLRQKKVQETQARKYCDQLVEKWLSAVDPAAILKDKLDDVSLTCSANLNVSISRKPSHQEWKFQVKCHKRLHRIALLQDANRSHFKMKDVSSRVLNNSVYKVYEVENNQEWVNPKQEDCENEVREYNVWVVFGSEIFGTFRQAVVFDFGGYPVLCQKMCVDVLPVEEVEIFSKAKVLLSDTYRWDESNSNIVEVDKNPCGLNIRDRALLNCYSLNNQNTMAKYLSWNAVREKHLTKNNYRNRLHEMLVLEQVEQYRQLASYNLKVPLKILSKYMMMGAYQMKYAVDGELYASMELSSDISEDTSAGRLITSNCVTVYLAPANKLIDGVKPKVYEAIIEHKCKNVIYLHLSALLVKELELKADTSVDMEIQFQLNNLPLCEMHSAIDRLMCLDLVFPNISIRPSLNYTPNRKWMEQLDPRLNPKQREAIYTIAAPLNVDIPPILLIGPFGTGKTFTLAQAVKQILLDPTTRILICTHSNSAADLYIKDYLLPFVNCGLEEARPLRLYYHNRWVQTVPKDIIQFCITEKGSNGLLKFRNPKEEDVLKHRVVVTTLSTSKELSYLSLKKGVFTHILMDEAAQAMECEALTPLSMAEANTRLVLAGDHMQLSPEVYSGYAREKKLHHSLLERLYSLYPPNFYYKIHLCENYRSHETIINFTSEVFYDKKLQASSQQPRHPRFAPLSFFTAMGEDVQDPTSTTFFNNAEVYEVAERVSELKASWPKEWGPWKDTEVGVVTPYSDQVLRIRSELRKRRMGSVVVERVLNVQGKQFRAIFLSTVRTRHTLESSETTKSNGEREHECLHNSFGGFLSNEKLLNTAITRAQSLVAVVGDPVSLCSLGKCRKLWERYLAMCNKDNSLKGMKWLDLREHLDAVELKRTYGLNPLAPEFVPRVPQAEPFVRFNSLMGPFNNYHGYMAAHLNSLYQGYPNPFMLPYMMPQYRPGMFPQPGPLYQPPFLPQFFPPFGGLPPGGLPLLPPFNPLPQQLPTVERPKADLKTKKGPKSTEANPALFPHPPKGFPFPFDKPPVFDPSMAFMGQYPFLGQPMFCPLRPSGPLVPRPPLPKNAVPSPSLTSSSPKQKSFESKTEVQEKCTKSRKSPTISACVKDPKTPLDASGRNTNIDHPNIIFGRNVHFGKGPAPTTTTSSSSSTQKLNLDIASHSKENPGLQQKKRETPVVSVSRMQDRALVAESSDDENLDELNTDVLETPDVVRNLDDLFNDATPTSVPEVLPQHRFPQASMTVEQLEKRLFGESSESPSQHYRLASSDRSNLSVAERIMASTYPKEAPQPSVAASSSPIACPRSRHSQSDVFSINDYSDSIARSLKQSCGISDDPFPLGQMGSRCDFFGSSLPYTEVSSSPPVDDSGKMTYARALRSSVSKKDDGRSKANDPLSLIAELGDRSQRKPGSNDYQYFG